MAATFASPVNAPLRLTGRGWAVLVGIPLVACLALVPLRAMAGSSGPAPAPLTVTVAPGDTLWGIAQRVEPSIDPRAEVAAIREANQLASSALTPGQVLVIPR